LKIWTFPKPKKKRRLGPLLLRLLLQPKKRNLVVAREIAARPRKDLEIAARRVAVIVRNENGGREMSVDLRIEPRAADESAAPRVVVLATTVWDQPLPVMPIEKLGVDLWRRRLRDGSGVPWTIAATKIDNTCIGPRPLDGPEPKPEEDHRKVPTIPPLWMLPMNLREILEKLALENPKKSNRIARRKVRRVERKNLE
jgi:hypothetical protein